MFSKQYTPNWTTEIFQKERVQREVPVTYLLHDANGQVESGCFYEYELLCYCVKNADVFLVEGVMRKKRKQVYVMWLGLDKGHNRGLPLRMCCEMFWVTSVLVYMWRKTSAAGALATLFDNQVLYRGANGFNVPHGRTQSRRPHWIIIKFLERSRRYRARTTEQRWKDSWKNPIITSGYYFRLMKLCSALDYHQYRLCFGFPTHFLNYTLIVRLYVLRK